MARTTTVLLVGGSGHWAGRENHVPALLEMRQSGWPVRTAVICDPRNPEKRAQDEDMAPLRELLWRDSPEWLNPDGLSRTELDAVLDRAHSTHRFSLAIIACNPVHHRDYILWAVSRGISVLCDKPLLVAEGAAYEPAAAERIIGGYAELDRALTRARAAGPCHLAMPLRRRANDVYRSIASDISEIQRVHGQGITSMQLIKNGGLFRHPEEYLFGDAHGYTSGVGALSFSSYHYIDLLAWYLELAPGEATALRVTNPYVRRVGEFLRTRQATALAELVDGREGVRIPELPPKVLAAEADFAFHVELLGQDGQKAGLVTYTCHSNTYSHRSVGLQEFDRTNRQPFREKGRMSQFTLDINQGSIQHIGVFKNDVVGEDYRIRVQRRRNPVVADEPYVEEVFHNAHAGSSVTPQDVLRAMVGLASGEAAPTQVADRISFFEDQRLSHHLFGTFYELIAMNAGGVGSAERFVELAG
ncbi:Gfo/Idh/MocA family oxidoreductase [Streptomyces sp. NBC_01762]|uniref:Gfo/Idh/MocA family oxidoreductase n=1 Tax=Streptomyces sp. NBC_01762 TaxID=2975933 RepID=UPI002DDA75D9|nr:Gfo/Idh/MocA family oxidoreductase [Streptomyces sp. NBC_01762]WSC45859.1 Gfo/Idh/MocA family oxidoreductase [Streptomyces sp. NBC_01762]